MEYEQQRSGSEGQVSRDLPEGKEHAESCLLGVWQKTNHLENDRDLQIVTSMSTRFSTVSMNWFLHAKMVKKRNSYLNIFHYSVV